MLSAVIEGIDFPTPFGAHRRDTIRGSSFQKTSSSALIIWSISSIKTKDLQQSLLQCLYFLSSIGLQICWVKVILTDQKANCEQQQLQPLATVVRSRNFHYGKKNVSVSLFLLSTHTLHGPLAGKLSPDQTLWEPASEAASLTQPSGTKTVGEWETFLHNEGAPEFPF